MNCLKSIDALIESNGSNPTKSFWASTIRNQAHTNLSQDHLTTRHGVAISRPKPIFAIFAMFAACSTSYPRVAILGLSSRVVVMKAAVG
jgi:hypothetical protein